MESSEMYDDTEEHPMTTIKRLLRRLDGYTLDAFNGPHTHARAQARAAGGGGRHAAR